MFDPKQLIEKHTNTIYIENQDGLEPSAPVYCRIKSSIGSFVKKPVLAIITDPLENLNEK
jgi:hypothetical protein